MSKTSDEIASYFGSSSMTDEEFLIHYGMPRRSGRYPWGSGEDPYQHGNDFLSRVETLRSKGWKETPDNIKKEFGLTVKQYRMEKSISKDERQIYRVATAKRMRKKEGLNTSEIAKKMGVNESTVRGWFKQDEEGRMYQTRQTANYLKKEVLKKKMVDVGVNVERDLNISREKLDTALYMLEREGFHVYGGRIPQATNKDKSTTQLVLTTPDKTNKDIFEYDKVKTLGEYISKDDGYTFEKKFTYPKSMDSKRLQIRYADDIGPDGAKGVDKDGVIELRRGVADLDLKGSRYAQVRILVDDTHYLKGMAIYSDDMPKGIDVIFNTNKTKDVPMKKVLKEIKKDPENPFGSNIKDVELGGQYWYTDKNGKKQLGLINKRADEGDWTEWKDTLPSQFLSKQSKVTAKKQLDLARATKEAEFDTIKSLNNPTVKKYYLEKFASECDSAAVDLKAAALPGQKYHVIIPNNTLKDNEIYAPGYKPGTKLALVRYPHGGTFEIPVCTVTDKNILGKKLIGTSPIDAVCINSKVAARLSGADFDGDTVMCIPTDDRKGKVKINRQDELKGLKGFDPKLEYGSKEVINSNGEKEYYRGNRKISIMKNTNTQMGIISNLITDMTLNGADNDELARAVRHSMVVIDAEKHKLDYKQSYVDNNIEALKKKYQAKYDEKGNLIPGKYGASTIISKAKSPYDIPKTKGEARINIKGKSWYDPNKPEGSLIRITAPDSERFYADSVYNKKTRIKTVTLVDGKTKISYNMDNKADRDKYEPIMKKDKKTGKVYFTNKDGSITYSTKERTTPSTRMAEVTDANELVSFNRHSMEVLYADYANSMKSLANKARIELVTTGNLNYNKTAKDTYAAEVSSLNSKLNDALKNSVKERTAQRLANAEIARKKELNPELKGEDLRKVSQRALTKYRNEIGSVSRKKRSINITDKEWEAIQAGAISERTLKQILNNSNPDVLREKAMPKDRKQLSQAQINRIKSMNNSNFSLSQIAEKMNLSPSTISKYLKGEI